MDLFDFAPILAIPAIGKTLDAYRQLVLEANLRKFAFTLGAWVVGTALVFLVAESSAGSTIPDTWGWADYVLVGIGLGSTSSILHDFATRGDVKVVAESAVIDPTATVVVADEGIVESEPTG
jgi:hypothetical protein